MDGITEKIKGLEEFAEADDLEYQLENHVT